MRSAVLITGASRGFGRCLAADFAREIESDTDLDLHLWARHEDDLKETERLAQDAWKLTHHSGTLRTFLVVVDLSDKDDYSPKIDAVLAQLKAENYARVYLVHNAGSLGQLGYTQEWTSHEMLDQYWQFNVHSVLWFNKRFLDEFGASREELQSESADASTQSLIVNITSLCGIQPFETHSLYCIGKAAREMHHAVIAKEQAPSPKIRVLQYSPGPMDTGMQTTIRESAAVAKELSQKYGEMKANVRNIRSVVVFCHEAADVLSCLCIAVQGTLIPPEKSSRLGVKLTLSGAFETGSHVDYYDIAPQE